MKKFIELSKNKYSVSVLFSNCFLFFKSIFKNIDIKGMNAVF